MILSAIGDVPPVRSILTRCIKHAWQIELDFPDEPDADGSLRVHGLVKNGSRKCRVTVESQPAGWRTLVEGKPYKCIPNMLGAIEEKLK